MVDCCDRICGCRRRHHGDDLHLVCSGGCCGAASLPLQFLVFALVSAVTLAIMVPMLASRRKGKKTPVTNGPALSVGKRGVVLQAILPGEIGRVRVDGLDWQARAAEALPQGSRCQVLSAEGNVLTVQAAPVEETV